ncbi:MAG: hypothetical protein LC775_14800 [Acidobacteria bacterium]|nr:hypothetical protein [Acidobacteriota bacterium]
MLDPVPRSLNALRPEVAAVNAACAACDYAILGQKVPNLIGELYTLAEIHGSAEVRRLLTDLLHAAFYNTANELTTQDTNRRCRRRP